MKHQVLARKWRPRSFNSLVGQDHVVKALQYALTTNNIHHAYLLTGTRGVGKTTLARLIAKSLNCLKGIGPHACQECSACVSIDSGRFVDYLELDAASNRSVEDIVPLLEGAIYAPVVGRYKVYVIDEVHMLSSHAFNAMLKTLEEPPSYVVFILATTDPQRIPITILSRCFQFKLRHVPVTFITNHLKHILHSEGVPFEEKALVCIAQAAAGSVRDALSITDQAIAFGSGSVLYQDVCDMLGVCGSEVLYKILDALLKADAVLLVQLAESIYQQNFSISRVLGELAVIFQRIAEVKSGAVVLGSDDVLAKFASEFLAEDVQVYYQVLLIGLRDLPLAPDQRTGISMTFLRLLAFRPQNLQLETSLSPRSKADCSVPESKSLVVQLDKDLDVQLNNGLIEENSLPESSLPERGPVALVIDWQDLAKNSAFQGLQGEFMSQSMLMKVEGARLFLRVPNKFLSGEKLVDSVRKSLVSILKTQVFLSVEVGDVNPEVTVAGKLAADESIQKEQFTDAIKNDLFVRSLVSDCDASIDWSSVAKFKKQ